MRQISGWESDAAKRFGENADLGKKVADKRKRRNDKYLKLQKAQLEAQKKQDRAYKDMQKSYESRIVTLSAQMLPHNALPTQEVYPCIGDAEKEYDVFVSHAWEDKESFTDEFVSELTILGIKVWYDKKKIGWGDSMRVKIDEGLRKSKLGISVISPNYISDGKYWTKAELDGLFQLESINGKMLLPVWHNITKKEVLAYSPIIAGKLAMSTATMTPKEIAEELQQVLNNSKGGESKEGQAEDS